MPYNDVTYRVNSVEGPSKLKKDEMVGKDAVIKKAPSVAHDAAPHHTVIHGTLDPRIAHTCL